MFKYIALLRKGIIEGNTDLIVEAYIGLTEENISWGKDIVDNVDEAKPQTIKEKKSKKTKQKINKEYTNGQEVQNIGEKIKSKTVSIQKGLIPNHFDQTSEEDKKWYKKLKKIKKDPPASTRAPYQPIKVECVICHKKNEVHPAYLTVSFGDREERVYKCNRCIGKVFKQ